jgi:hypothetical protein
LKILPLAVDKGNSGSFHARTYIIGTKQLSGQKERGSFSIGKSFILIRIDKPKGNPSGGFVGKLLRQSAQESLNIIFNLLNYQ